MAVGDGDAIFLLGGAVNLPAGYNCNVTDQRYYFTDAAAPLAGGVMVMSQPSVVMTRSTFSS